MSSSTSSSSSSHPTITAVTDSGAATTPSADRNKIPITVELSRLFQTGGEDVPVVPIRILELASGTGQHAAHFCKTLPFISHFQPSDESDVLFPSIVAHGDASLSVAERHRLAAPRVLNVLQLEETSEWVETESYDCVIIINLLHIAPQEATIGALTLASRALKKRDASGGGGGKLVLYGPFTIDGIPTTDSNKNFDTDLKSRDSRWGLRDIATIKLLAESKGLHFSQQIDMPANNHLLVFNAAS